MDRIIANMGSKGLYKSIESLTSIQMERIIAGELFTKRKGSLDLDPKKWKDATPSEVALIKAQDLSVIPVN
jgi:hypothetical protein